MITEALFSLTHSEREESLADPSGLYHAGTPPAILCLLLLHGSWKATYFIFSPRFLLDLHLIRLETKTCLLSSSSWWPTANKKTRKATYVWLCGVYKNNVHECESNRQFINFKIRYFIMLLRGMWYKLRFQFLKM